MALATFVATVGLTVLPAATQAQASEAYAPDSTVAAAKQANLSKGAAALAVTCARGVACFWNDANYTGTLETYLGSQQGCHNFTSRVNNKISSLRNNSGQLIRVYKDANCTGIWYKNFPDTYGTSNLQYTGYNDTFSSVRINP